MRFIVNSVEQRLHLPSRVRAQPKELSSRCRGLWPLVNFHSQSPFFVDKDKWINTERLRWAKRFSIPMQMDMPPGFPPSTVTTMRALAAVEGGQATVGLFNPQDELVHALDSLYTAFWVHHTPVYMVDPLAKTLAKALGQDQATVIMNKTSLPECKALLAANTKLAFEKGAFGLPWFSCTNSSGEEQGFWGVDHLGQVLEFLELEHPKSATWKALL